MTEKLKPISPTVAIKPKTPLILIALLSIVLYANTINQSIFIWDDFQLIVNNNPLRQLKNIPMFFTADYWKKFHPIDQPGQYRPVRTTSFALDYALFGENIAGYHVTNVFLNAICVVLVCMFFSGISRRSDPGPETRESPSETVSRMFPVFAALMFAMHPAHAETVVWIKNRSSLLAAVFLIAGFLCFLKFVHRPGLRTALLLWIAGLPCYMLSIASYEIGIVLPVLFLLYGLLFSPAHRKAALIGIIPFFIVALLYLHFKFTILTITKASPGLIDRSLLEDIPHLNSYPHLLLILATYFKYFAILAFPVELNVERMLNAPDSILNAEPLGGVLLILAIALSLYRFRQNRFFVFGLLWTVITLLPVSNIVYIWTRPLAEQRLYIPSIGFCLMLFALVAGVCRRMFKFSKHLGILTAIALCLVITAYAARTFIRNREWNHELEFWKKTTEQNPESPRAWLGLSTAYRLRGKTGKEEAAIREAIRVNPYFDQAHYDLAAFYERQKKFDRAIETYMRVTKLSPLESRTYRKMGELYFNQKDYRNAEANFQKAGELYPGSSESFYYLGEIQVQTGNYEQAIAFFRKAIDINPYSIKAINDLANVHHILGDYDEAIGLYRQAIDIDPSYMDAKYNLGKTYLAKGEYENAIEIYRQVLTVHPDHINSNNNIGAAYLIKGEHEIAISYFQKAIALDPTFAEPYNNMGFIYFKREQYQMAIKYVDKAKALGWAVDPRFLKDLEPHREAEDIPDESDQNPAANPG